MPSPFVFNSSPGASTFPITIDRERIPGQVLPDQGTGADLERQRIIARLMQGTPAGAPKVKIPLTPDGTVNMESVDDPNQEDFPRRKQIFAKLFQKLAQDPNAQQALLAAAVQILKPIEQGSGETTLSRLVQGALVGTSTKRQLDTAEEDRAKEFNVVPPDRFDEFNLPPSLADRAIVLEKANGDIRIEKFPAADRQAEEAERKSTGRNLLIESLLADNSLDEQTRVRATALITAGNTGEALDLVKEASGTKGFTRLTPDEVEETFPMVDPSQTVVQRGPDNRHYFTHLKDDDPNNAERKLQIYRELARRANPEASPEEVEQIALEAFSGAKTVSVSDDGQQVTLVDTIELVSSGGKQGATTVFREPPESEEDDASVVNPEEGLVGEIAERAAGITPFVDSVIAHIPGRGQLTEDQAKTLHARGRVRQFNRQLIRARMLNPRAPAWEQEMITKESSIQPKMLSNPPALRQHIRTLDETLEIEIRQAKQDLKRGAFSGKERQKLRASLRGMENGRDTLAVKQFEDLYSQLAGASPQEAVQAVQKMTINQLRLIKFAARDSELQKIPKEALRVMIDRLNAGE